MALFIPTSSANRMLAHILNADSPEDLELRLYINDVAPDSENTIAHYIEAHGYQPRLLRGRDWTIENAIARAPAQVFRFSGFKGAVYGYLLALANSGDLMWSEPFSVGPYIIQNNGDQITIIPSINLSQ